MINPGTEQHTIGAGHRIINTSEFPNVRKGGTSNLLGSIGMYLATTMTVVESTDGPVILKVHQAITYDQARRKSEVESLLCVAQAQEHGIIVDSNAQKFGGLQCMVINQEDERYIIPFLFKEGTTIMPHREPKD